MFAKWVQSYRDLPLLINQWANVVRWKCGRVCSCARSSSCGRKDTRPTRRTTKAEEEARRILGIYSDFNGRLDGDARVTGLKTDAERSPAPCARTRARR